MPNLVDLRYEEKALKNYEIYNKLPKGTATIEQVHASSAGLEYFAKWNPPEGSDDSMNEE